MYRFAYLAYTFGLIGRSYCLAILTALISASLSYAMTRRNALWTIVGLVFPLPPPCSQRLTITLAWQSALYTFAGVSSHCLKWAYSWTSTCSQSLLPPATLMTRLSSSKKPDALQPSPELSCCPLPIKKRNP